MPDARPDPAPADVEDPDVDPEVDENEHPDHVTRREALEQELLEEGRSKAGEDIGQHID